jgi:hypothetical protein
MPAGIAESPLGPRLRTFLHHLRAGARNLSDDDLTSTWSQTNPRYQLLRDSFVQMGDRITGFAVAGYEQVQPFAGVGLLRGADGRDWRCCVVVDDQPPHLILESVVFPSPAGVTAREARDSDAAALREIERRTPIVAGGAQVYYDRGEDYFAGERLMGDVEMFVVERDGRIIGLGGRAFPEIRVAGEVSRGLYSHRLRLLPEAQGEGAQGPLNAIKMLTGVGRRYLSYAFVAEGNEAATRRMEQRSFWAVGASRLVLDTRHAASEAVGRSATVSDVRRLVELFNVTHEREELFVPLTEESLSLRFARAPDLYTWSNVLLGERAAIGVWPARLGVRRESQGVVTHDVRALLLDFGYAPGAEDELIALIGAACSQLDAQGTTELSAFSSNPSPIFPALSTLAKRTEPYLVACFKAPGPALERRGVYVDQLYF